MQRVLVTGSRGFTGTHLAAELSAHGWQVHGLPAGCDLRDAAALHTAVQQVQPHAVIHLAAIAFVAHDDAQALYHVNLLGTRHLLAALAALPTTPRHIVLASSANIYGNQQPGMLAEDTPAQPANDYAVSKLAMEHLARLWSDHLPITIVRPFNYTGRGQSPHFLIAKIIDHVRRRAPSIALGNLHIARDFCDVRAVATAYRRLLGTPAAIGQSINICRGQTHTLHDVLHMAQSLGGHQCTVEVNPALVRTREVDSLCGNPARLRSLIGADWAPPPLQDTLSWMLDDTP